MAIFSSSTTAERWRRWVYNLINPEGASNGDVLTADGSGGASFQAPAGGGGGSGSWELLETATPGGLVTEIDITWDESLYSSIRLDLEGLRPTTDGTTFRLRLGHANGGTIVSADYDGIQRTWEGAGAWAGLTDATRVDLAQSCGALAGETIHGVVEIEGGRSADVGAMIVSRIYYINSSGNQRVIETKAFMDDGQNIAIDTVRFFFSAGFFANFGDIKVYGLTR